MREAATVVPFIPFSSILARLLQGGESEKKMKKGKGDLLADASLGTNVSEADSPSTHRHIRVLCVHNVRVPSVPILWSGI
jgi:hypothetical protein